MHFKLRILIIIILSIAIGIGLVIYANRWHQEPTSFLGIKIDEPLSSFVSLKCPDHPFDSDGRGLEREGLPDGANCYDSESGYRDGSIDIYPYHLQPLFYETVVYTNDGSINGKVVSIQAAFESEDPYAAPRVDGGPSVMEIIIAKFGPPHHRQTIDGDEIQEWNGNKVSIRVTTRRDLGEIEFYNRDFTKMKMAAEEQKKIKKNEAASSEAEKF